jgi:hypothetical protein
MTRLLAILVVLTASPVAVARTEAQSLGTLRWQLQPFCNVVTLNVNQQGAVYTLDGYDDQCGAAQRAPLVGLATPNPDGSIGFGLHVVTVPGGRGVQIDARITLATLSGPWSDSAGNSGTFAFGAATGGSARPAPTTGSGGGTIPPTFALLTDGGFLARGTISVGAIPASGAGTRLMWYPKKAAFRAGEVTFPGWDDVNIGSHSAAFGFNSVATGPYSLAGGADSVAQGIASVAIGSNAGAVGNYSAAFGANTRANGAMSVAFGQNTVATGSHSAAFGLGSTALGTHSLAFGQNSVTTAGGVYSAAFGNATTASGNGSFAAGINAFTNGDASIALGLRVSAGGNGTVVLGSDAVAQASAAGGFIFADRSTTTDFVASQPNEFNVRAAGGVALHTNAGLTAGVVIGPGGSSWASISDVNAKENFRDVSGEDVLAKIAALSIREWNYKTQDASVRHIGPTAQEFRSAFGLGQFPLRIDTIDADGVAFAALQALEARTRATNERLTRDNDDLRARLARLESLLEKSGGRR